MDYRIDRACEAVQVHLPTVIALGDTRREVQLPINRRGKGLGNEGREEGEKRWVGVVGRACSHSRGERISMEKGYAARRETRQNR